MSYLLAFASLGLAGLDGYQAITGKRVNKRPSRRTDAQMRRQSAIAAVVLGVLGLIVLAGAIANG